MLQKYQNSYLSYFLMYTFYFLSWSLFSTLISVYLLDLGYKPSHVSLVVSTSFLASMVAQPLIGMVIDHFRLKKVTMILFALSILGNVLFLFSNSLILFVLSYSWVLLLINGTIPVLEKLATTGPFAYGKIRIWGTIGFSLGSQLSGLIYDYVSPKAIFLVFILTMSLSILGVYGTNDSDDRSTSENAPKQETAREKPAAEVANKSMLSNKTFLFYMLLSSIFTGVMSTGHTYIPALLEDAGLSVNLASTVVSVAVLCEAPFTFFSYLFMDRFKSKTLLYIPIGLVVSQYLIYALDINLASKVAVTLLAKHTAGIIYIMVNTKIVASLVERKILITALALVQTGRNLFSILFQHISGQILDVSSYAVMSAFLLAMTLLVLILLRIIRLPDGNDQKLFS